MHKGGPDPIWSIPFCARKTGESMCKTEENPARGREKLAAFGYFSEDVLPNRVNNDCSKTLYSSQGSGLVTRCNIVRQASSFVLLWFSSPSNTKLLFAPRFRSSVRLILVTPQEHRRKIRRAGARNWRRSGIFQRTCFPIENRVNN